MVLWVDRPGTLWIGSIGVLISYDWQTGRFKTFTNADGLTNDRIRRIKDDMKGNLWISFWSSYVNRYANGKFTAFDNSDGLTGKKIDIIFEDEKGNLLFGSRENGIFRFQEEHFSQYSIPGLEDLQITSICEDDKGRLWIGTKNGLFRFNGDVSSRFTTADGLIDDYVTSIIRDSDLNLWVGTEKGLNRLQVKSPDTVGIERLLTPHLIYSLFEDREKNVWVGTSGSGLIRLKDSKFISYAPLQSFPAETFLSIFADFKGDIWAGTLSGKLSHSRGNEMIESIESPQFTGTGITALAEDIDKNLWVGTNGRGVFQKQGNRFVPLAGPGRLTDNQVTSIYSDSRGNLWFSTVDGVSVRRYPGGAIESFTERDGLSGKRVNNVYEDKNLDIWIAADRGITVLKAGKCSKQKARYYMKGDFITCIYEDPSAPGSKDGIYWIATDGAGLKRLSLKDNKIKSFTTKDGLVTNSLYQFFEDREGNFWLMSNSGILRVSKSQLNRFAAGETDNINCISYGTADGMKSAEFHNEFSRHSALKAGALWFITKKGISILDPEKIRINKEPPPVVLEAVFFDQQSIPRHPDAGPHTCKGIKDFTFHFTAPSFLSPGKIKFKYYLEGYDNDWKFPAPGSERKAVYQNLAPGTYTFNVTACNAAGVWNPQGASFTFTLEPFFYQTLLFKIGMLLLLALLSTAGFYLYRFYKKRSLERKAKEKEKEKYKSSSLNPLFVEEKTKQLKHLMEEDRLYREENISLQSLAEQLSLSSHQLSQILNETLKQSFSDFINSYRIAEVRKIFSNPKGAEKKNSTVAQEVGFNSLTAFYKAFKKYTGMTPSQFKKNV